MKKVGIIFLCMAILTGCASTHMTKLDKAPVLTSSPDSASLVIIRDTFWGKLAIFSYYLDRELIGQTWGNTYFMTYVTPGKHNIVTLTDANSTVSHFDFKPGNIYFLGQKLAYDAWRGYLSAGFYPMTQEEALKAMSNSKYLEYNPETSQEEMDAQLYAKAIDEYQKDIKKNPDGYKDILNYDGVVLK